jgi:hypothetical protein
MKLLWGVIAQVVTQEQFQQPRVTAREVVARLGLAASGDTILLLSGVAGDEPSLIVLKI